MAANRVLDNGAGRNQPATGTGGRPVISRRDFLVQGSSVLALLALMEGPLWAQIQDATEAEKIVPFLDQPPAPPEQVIEQFGELNKLNWQHLSSWITSNTGFFNVSHYNRPVIRPEDWRLEIGGLVERPVSLTLDQLKARPRQEVTFTLECAGNHGFEWFVGGVGNATWGGTPLAPLLNEAGITANGLEVVFFGSDAGEEEVRNIKMTQNFSRSMSLEDALAPANLLCYEMNGEPLPPFNGFPLRLITPGWYGVANVKWLARIEIINQRWAGRFMTKDYVTIREEPREDGNKVWTQKVVGRSLVKSVTARVTVKDGKHRIYGAAWGAPIHRVEVRIDEGPWRPATIDRGHEHEFAWKFWHLDWEAKPGDHTITSRAIDTTGNIQPAMTDPVIAGKRTYWESNGQITRRVRIA
jgi:DMSO/TMAO reductase YedYZ molybdopterin-dependent catalytic subunit